MTTILKITGMLTLVVGVQLINTPVSLTPLKPYGQNVIEAVNYAPPDGGHPKMSLGSGTR